MNKRLSLSMIVVLSIFGILLAGTTVADGIGIQQGQVNATVSFNATFASLFDNSSILILQSGNFTNQTVHGNITGVSGIISSFNFGRGTQITRTCSVLNPICTETATGVSLPILDVFSNMQNVSGAEYDDLAQAAELDNITVESVALNETYGSFNYSNGTTISAGLSPRYLIYDNATSTLYNYTIDIEKATPVLAITIGNVTVTSDANILVSDFNANGTGFKLQPGPYRFSVNLSATALNNLTYSYAMRRPGGSVLNTTTNDVLNATKNFTLLPGQTLNVTFESGGNANYTEVDPTVYFTVANVNEVIGGTTTLGSDLVAGNLTVNNGVTVNTNGYNIYVSGNLIAEDDAFNSGTALAGGSNGGGHGGNGASALNSFGGSGGAGGCEGACGGGGTGGATLSAGGVANGGNGATPANPTVNNANIIAWYGSGLKTYLEGASAGGGGGDGGGFGGGKGGTSSFGLYLQANSLILTATTITTTGGKGTGGDCGDNYDVGNGGGGGAGSIILAYNSIYGPGTYVAIGGAQGGGCGGAGGIGGSGTNTAYQYASAPITIQGPVNGPTIVASVTGNIIVGNNDIFTANIIGGIQPYAYQFYVVNSVTGAQLASQSYSNVYATSQTFTWTVPNSNIGNAIEANVVVTDTGTGTVASSYTSVVKVLNFSAAISPASVSLTAGTPQTFITTVNGGFEPYTFTWNIGTGAGITTAVHSGVTSNTDTYSFSTSNFGTYTVNAVVTDSGTPSITRNTTNAIITISGGGGGGSGGGGGTGGGETGGGTNPGPQNCGIGTVYNATTQLCQASQAIYIPPSTAYNLSSQLPIPVLVNNYLRTAFAYFTEGYFQPLAWLSTYIAIPQELMWLVMLKITPFEVALVIAGIIALMSGLIALNSKVRNPNGQVKGASALKISVAALVILGIIYLLVTVL